MGKKKKAGKKKGGAGAAEVVDDGPAAAEAAKKKALKDRCVELKKRVAAEDNEFNEFQQQREKLNYFWIVEKKSLEDKRAELRNKEREEQDLEEKHAVEIKVYKQRVKHLLYEHQNEITHLRTEAESALQLVQEEFMRGEAEIKGDKRSLKVDLKEMGLSHEDYLKSLKQEQDRAITLLRQMFERRAKELQLKYERKSKTLREDLEAQRKAEISAIEKRKNGHTDELMKTHEKAFGEIKNYYNDITHNNLDLIKSLKEEVAEMKKKESADEKLMFEIAQENKRMSEPLKQALQDVERLRSELDDYKLVEERLRTTKARLLVVEGHLKALTWEHEVLSQRFEIVEKERDELYAQFQSTIYEVQQKSGFRNLVLEKKCAALGEQLEKTDGYLNEVLHQFKLSPSVLGHVQKKLDDIIEAKNQAVRDLQQGLAQAIYQHNEAIGTYETKLGEYGIPVEELGFRPALQQLPVIGTTT